MHEFLMCIILLFWQLMFQNVFYFHMLKRCAKILIQATQMAAGERFRDWQASEQGERTVH